MMLLPVAALLLLASGTLTGANPAPAPGPSVVVLRDGTRFTLARPYEVKGAQARLPLATGQLVSIRANEIDEEASRRATEEARRPAPPPPTPAAVAATTPGAPRKGTFSASDSTVTGGGYSVPGSTSSTGSKGGPVQVRAYTRSDGTRVDAYTRSAPGTAKKN